MLIQTLASDPRTFFAVLMAVVISICFHELAHGLVAIALGDQTPIEMGHMTLNPMVHLGIPSLICLALVGIAWGAMPVDRSRLRGKYAEALVSAAGPLANMLMAIVALVALGLWQRFDPRLLAELSAPAANGRFLLGVFGLCNIHLMLFNLIPVPPWMDQGSSAASASLLPKQPGSLPTWRPSWPCACRSFSSLSPGW